MRTDKKILFGTFFLFVILFSLSPLSAYAISNPQFTAPGANSFSYLGAQGITPFPIFNGNQCGAGQDFIVQVAPFGCEPAVVRSDLLEEQNVPVFCQLSAIKVNPLVNVKAIDTLSFSGNYPPEVAGIGFHPANAALTSTTTTILNSPVLQNIGYAVIVLKQQPNESAMPDSVSGNLTAMIKYNIQNAFGIGPVTQYLPELTGQQWNQKYTQYSFWGGKGFLKADGITTDGAIISLYSGKDTKISTFSLKKGETSGNNYLPGFYCQASLALRLDDVQTPDTRVKLQVNGEIVEVAAGEKFADNQCSPTVIDKKGINKGVEIGCATDTGFERISLRLSPSVRISVNGEERNVNLGDKIFQRADNQGSVYLAYIGTNDDSQNPDDLFLYFLSTPQDKNNLTNEELASTKSMINQLNYNRITGGSLIDIPGNILNKYIGFANLIKQYIADKKDITRLNFKESGVEVIKKNIYGNDLKIAGFAGATDSEIKDLTAKNYYTSAMADYRKIIESFTNEKEDPNSQSTFGEQAMVKAIKLSSDMQQKKTASDLCQTFLQKYPNNKDESSVYCNSYQSSNNEPISKGVFINGQVKLISLLDVSEPSLSDFSADILVKSSDGTTELHTMAKNEIVVLNQNSGDLFRYVIPNPEANPIIGGGNGDIFATPLNIIYFGYIDGKWKWSEDGTNWIELTQTNGLQKNKEIQPRRIDDKKTLELLKNLQDKDYASGSTILTDNYGAVKGPYTGGNDYIQLIDLTENSARLRVNSRGTTNYFSDNVVINRNVGQSTGNYILTLTSITLKKLARVSVIPAINNAGTQANLSFTINIEKRAIQLSPDEIRKRIDVLNASIAQWEDNSAKLGKVVMGFNAACLTVGTTLTIKNFFENFGGAAIARQEVMRSPGGWMNICKNKVNEREFGTLDACLLKNSDQIEADVNTVANVIKTQEGITKDNANDKLNSIRDSFGSLGNSITDPNNKTKSIDLSQNSDVYSAFSQQGYKDGKISLTQAKDVERLQTILNDQSTSPELRDIAQRELYKTLSDIKANAQSFAAYTSLQSDLKNAGLDLNVNSYGGKNAIQGSYSGGVLKGDQISGVSGLNPTTSYPTEVVVYNNQKYVLLLDGDGTNYFINKVYQYGGASASGIVLNPATDQEETLVKNSFSKFVKLDRTTYTNQFKDPQVRYFETEPYKGLPAIVPFDLNKGWYAATKQTVSGLGNIKAYDESGKINSFYLCNVGKNGREEFNSETSDDICRSFNPGLGQIQGEFPGLTQAETNTIVAKATTAVQDASRQYKPGLAGNVKIGDGIIKVGPPSAGIPDVQCQDFMSAKECNLMFNVCDPVVCPSSRCNLGGAYSVPDVIQSGIIGSLALCLPNARENIAVPICLSGVKAGVDGFISVEKNYRDCLQTNLRTGQTVGICDEIHSVYLCDFFWSQAQPLAKIIIPKLFETISGQTGRGGGEYLGVASAWANAAKSVDYMTNYYGAASFEAFRTGIIKEVGNQICRTFVSASYPSGMNFFDSLIQPKSLPQYTAWFSEAPYTTATVPPTSRYKVFYHIFAGNNTAQAGKNAGIFFTVYLKSPVGSSFYQYAPTVTVATGFIAPGNFASETKDFTAPSNYKQLCININGNEQCGFNQVSTDFGLNYAQDFARQATASQTDISSESNCVSGTPSLYSFINPNVQTGLTNFVDPSLSSQQIVRICSTDNPGKGTDPLSGTPQSKWVQVGTCDAGKGNVKCFLDTTSINTAIKSLDIQNATLKTVVDNYTQGLINQGQYLQDFDGQISKINEFDNKGKISYITSDFIAKAFLNGQKAKLFFIRAEAYAALALEKFGLLRTATTPSVTEFDLTTKAGWDACMAKWNDELTCGTNPAGTTSQGMIDKLNSALKKLNDDFINKYGKMNYGGTILSSIDAENPLNNLQIVQAYPNFVDDLHAQRLLNDAEWNQIKAGTTSDLKDLLQKKIDDLNLKIVTAVIYDLNSALEMANSIAQQYGQIYYSASSNPVNQETPFLLVDANAIYVSFVDRLNSQTPKLLSDDEYSQIKSGTTYDLQKLLQSKIANLGVVPVLNTFTLSSGGLFGYFQSSFQYRYSSEWEWYGSNGWTKVSNEKVPSDPQNKAMAENLRNLPYHDGLQLLLAKKVELDGKLSTASVEFSAKNILFVSQKEEGKAPKIYLQNENNQWTWNIAPNNWIAVTDITNTRLGIYVNAKNQQLINSLDGKNLYDGAELIFGIDATTQ